jgi:hypothetical protein
MNKEPRSKYLPYSKVLKLLKQAELDKATLREALHSIAFRVNSASDELSRYDALRPVQYNLRQETKRHE